MTCILLDSENKKIVVKVLFMIFFVKLL